MEEKEINGNNDIQSLLINNTEEEKEEENFEAKMDSLFSKLDAQFEKVKRYANMDIPLSQVEINKYRFRYNFQPDNNFINNKNLIDINNNNNNINKDNNENDETIELNNKKVEIKEIKDDEEMKKKMYNEIDFQRMEEERKIKEMEFERKRQKILEEEKRIKEEQRKREEALNKKEKELKDREREIKIKREKEEKRIKEERRRIEEEIEANEKSRILKEEEEKLKKDEEEKEKEQKIEKDRIKEMRIQREKQEREEKERKKKEEEKMQQIEKMKKEKEIQEQQKLKEQIKINNDNNSELKIEEIKNDDSIEELEEYDSSYTKSRIKESKNNNLFKSNLKSINPEINNSRLNPKNKTNISTNKFNNQSRNRFMFPTKKSLLKESMNKSMKKPKEEKKPENDLFKEKKKKNREESEFAKKFKNSKAYSKISQDIIDKILENIYAIDDFEEKKSEYDEINIYPSITGFDKEEKKLKELIPEFESKILEKEKLNVEDRMKKYYNEEEAFEKNQENEKIKELLIEIMHSTKETHMDLLQKKFDQENLKNLSTKEFENIENLEEIEYKLFEKEKFYPEYNPIISNLENLQTFIYKYRDSAEEKPDIMINSYKYFNYWRSCLNDGNSFYRVNIFALIEHCILTKDFQFFSYILNEICGDDFIEYYKEKNIEYERPFRILSVIWLFTQSKLEEKAHEFLIKAYNLKDGCLDILLITYLKKVLINFGGEINELLEEKKKTEENVDLIEEAKIDIDQIENMYLDPPKINLFYLISELFNINITLYFLGGNYLDPINTLIEIENIESSPTFVFGFFYSGYHVLYLPDYENESEIFKSIVENDNPQLCRLTHQLKDDRKCDICFKLTKHVVFLKKKFIVCIPCLLDHLNEKIKTRSENFFADKCLGQEYYSRPIHLQDDFYIDDFEYSELIEEDNIINKIYSSNKSNKCVDCERLQSDDVELKVMECKCRFCTECLQKIFMKMTKNYGYLLPCEVELYNTRFKCDCGKMYSYNDLEKLCKIPDERKEAAKERLSQYKDNFCLICMKNLIKDIDMKKVKIRKEDADDKDHFICNKCYCKHFKNVDLDSDDEDNTKEDNNEDDKDDDDEVKVIKDEHKIKCKICQKWHNYVGNVESCGCNIF